MRMYGLIGAASLAIVVSGSAMAASVGPAELPSGYHGRYVRHHYMRAQDYDHFDYGIARPRYPSGWGGPYGDGEYPGSIDHNMGPPYW